MAKNGNSAPSEEWITERAKIWKRGKVWQLQAQNNGKQIRRSLGTGNKEQAKQRAVRKIAEIEAGLLMKKPLQIDIEKLCEEYTTYLTAEGRRASTLTRYRSILNEFTEFALSKNVKSAHRIDVRTLDKYRAYLKERGKGSKTIYTETTVIKQLVKFACSRGLISKNTLAEYRNRKPKPTEQPNYTPEQVDQIIAVSKPHWARVYTVMAFTGLRIGELVNLEWSDVDLGDGVINVRVKAFWQPKDGDARRFPMHDRVREVLTALPRKNNWVFTNKKGEQIADRRALANVKRALKKIGLERGTVHTFRRFFISYCANKNVPPMMLAEWVGHSSLEMVLHYYKASLETSQQVMKDLEK